MSKARNGVRHSIQKKTKARMMRKEGKTHGEIVNLLDVSRSTAWLWTRDIHPTVLQKQAIEERRTMHTFSPTEKQRVIKRLKPHQYKIQYSDENLLNKIREYHSRNGRIPLKKEFKAPRIYRIRFGSWNNAIKKAGFETNPVLFAKKYVAKDGHVCDSFSEKIVDDWLRANGIKHTRSFRYGTTKMTADFFVEPNFVLEFFGLAGVKSQYDALIVKKRRLCSDLGLRLIEIYPQDIFPSNKLPKLLKSFL